MCSDGMFRSNMEAQKVAMIIAGDVSTIRSIGPQLDNWFELVPPYLLFVRPCATLTQLREVVKVMFPCLTSYVVDIFCSHLYYCFSTLNSCSSHLRCESGPGKFVYIEDHPIIIILG